LQEGSRGQSCDPRSARRSNRLMRGISPVSGRDLFDSTGLLIETRPVPSRKTM